MIHFSGTVIALFLLFEIIREILLRKPIIAGFFIFATIIWTLVFSRFSYKLFKPKDVQKIAYIPEPKLYYAVFIFLYCSSLLLGCYIFYQTMNKYKWFYTITSIFSFLLVWVGAFCHRRAVEQLGNRWVDGIVVQPEQKIEIKKWYSIVRHPVYFSNLLLSIGTNFFFFFSLITAIFTGIIYFIAANNRASKEEQLLIQHIPQYEEYRKKTPAKLLPKPSEFFKMLFTDFRNWY
jgi:protein-S-isoprenylcysteine O-methyltransferase Ste14